MARRVNSELLLVGSLPADSTETALREAAGFFGDLVFALPDGETGRGRPGSATSGSGSSGRTRAWSPSQETESPTGIPRHAYETPVFGDPARRHRTALGVLAAHRRRDRVLPGVPRRCATTG